MVYITASKVLYQPQINPKSQPSGSTGVYYIELIRITVVEIGPAHAFL